MMELEYGLLVGLGIVCPILLAYIAIVVPLKVSEWNDRRYQSRRQLPPSCERLDPSTKYEDPDLITTCRRAFFDE